MTAPTAPEQPLWAADWRAIGTSVRLVVTRQDALAPARRRLEAQLAELDLACSRFRPDSELMQLAAAGCPVPVSPLLTELVAAALGAAQATGGDLDPTIGGLLAAAGYDRDFSLVPADGPPVRVVLRQRPSWRDIKLDAGRRLLTVPPGVTLDLGATAKAWAADRAAASLAAELGCGVLASLGGDIAVAGPAPAQGWGIRVQDVTGHPGATPGGQSATVKIRGGGLATSSSAARSWRRGGQAWHHIMDPRTAAPARPVWRTVSVAAATALDANVASTASIIRGHGAITFLATRGLAARLVSASGEVVWAGGWPEDGAA
jgi:thiamine biosynthesis lipoprotein ApbE